MALKPGNNWRKYRRENDLFEKVAPYIPRNTHAILRALSLERGLPVSRLIAIAIDNELDQEIPFSYPVDLPDTYTEYLYAKECAALLTALQKAPAGVGRDMLVLARRDLGIADRDVLLTCLRELYDKGLAEEILPLNPKFGFFHKAYRYVRAVGLPKRLKKYRSIEGASTKGQTVVTDQHVARGDDEEDDRYE